MILAAIFFQAIIFQIFGQIAKRLQEQGVSSLKILYYQRYAFFPSAAALIFFWNKNSLVFLKTHSEISLTFFGFLIASLIFQYFYFVSRHITRSLAFVSAILNAIGLPLLLLGGLIINHDIPKYYEIIGICLLVLATFLKPSSATNNPNEKQYLYPISTILLISFVYLFLQFIKDPLYRKFLTAMPSIWFALSLWLFCFTLALNIFFLFKKAPVQKPEGSNLKPMLYSIPILFFIGSIPEAYGFAKVPVYTLVAITMTTFLMSLASDLYNRRIKLNLQTITFSLLVIAGVSLNLLARF